MLSKTRPRYQFVYLSVCLPQPICLTMGMSSELIELEKSVEDIIKKFMDDRVMSKGV
jgi:hypothetical protein